MTVSGPLEGVRVVDVATPRAELVGRILADLGAEVLKIEPQGGAEARRMPPFESGREGDAEASLYWASVALGKRSLVLDIFSSAGAARLRELLATADVFVESFDPGVLDARGLDFAALGAEFPALVYASVSAFGQTGPLAHAPATDLTLQAAGGLVGLQGDRDRPPIPVGYPQAWFHASAQAAADVVIALNERLRSGLGQHLDASAQAAVVWTLMNATGYPPAIGGNTPGTSEFRGGPPPEIVPGLRVPQQWQCADGYFVAGFGLPLVGERTLHAVMRWAEASGGLPEELCGIEWSHWIASLVGGQLTTEQLGQAFAALERFAATKTKAEVQAWAVENEVLLAAIYDVADLRHDRQLEAREFWTDVGGRTHPGPFALLTETPLVLERPAPRLGEAEGEVESAARPKLPAAPKSGATHERTFDGLKVADFAWVGVGPIISKALADHGATVVHVESEARLDVLRQLPPFVNNERGLNRSLFPTNFNTSKLGLTLDMTTEPGRHLARRLADWADVVVESFTPGTMKKLGLDYESLTSERSDLVMLSTCMRGQTGPERTYTGFGNQGAALAGISSVTGWPDRPPVGPWGAYTDFIAPRYGVASLMSALYHRSRTGRGQHIDVSQIEAAMRFIEPLILDYTVNGRVAGPVGHDSPTACPHGVYATAGVERYVAVAVETEEQWAGLRSVVSFDGVSGGLEGLEERQKVRAALDAGLREFCAERDPFEVAEQLRAAGVPAYAVLRPTDLYEDPQLAHREFFVTWEHAELGPIPSDGLVTHFSRTPGRLGPAPTLGEHTHEVLTEILGLSDDEIAEYAALGALT